LEIAGYGGIKEYIVVIAAVIYVAAMFPLLYYYQVDPASRFTLIPDLTWFSTFGCILLFGQWIVGALTAPSKPVEKPASS
jgi:hypothetical protein